MSIYLDLPDLIKASYMHYFKSRPIYRYISRDTGILFKTIW